MPLSNDETIEDMIQEIKEPRPTLIQSKDDPPQQAQSKIINNQGTKIKDQPRTLIKDCSNKLGIHQGPLE